MAELAVEASSAPRAIVIADSDQDRLKLSSAALSAAGFTIHPASDAASLAGQMARHRPAVVVMDSALAGGHAAEGVPVLLLVNLADEFDLGAVDNWGDADYILNPPRPEELVHRVETLIGRARERHRIRSGAEALRESLRKVSAAIRSTNDPQQIADLVVSGFGGALDADRVWFATFRDERVPRIRSQWNRRGLAQLPARLGSHEDALTEMANRLWGEADVLTVANHGDVPTSPISMLLGAWAGPLSPRSSVLVPVGEGESALGVILIATADEPREWTRTEISLIQHVAGNVAHGLIQGHLISAQQQVLQQLRQLDKAKTDFLATVNHELRTPLTSITAYLDMIREGAGGPVPEGIQRMVEVISRNSDRLRRLIEDMLTVSKQEGTGSLNLKRVDIGQVLQIVVATLRPLADTRDVEITFNESAEDIKINADEAQLEQVFTNIVANAIKFTPDGGQIGITSEPSAADDGRPAVLVQVADTGVGIPEQEIPQVFTRFYRASNASSAAVPGSGLGLAIAQDIVRRHTGHLELHSKLGRGTTVSVQLPVGGP
ncbi:ATP-binding protein [Arthrobacter sp. ISL-30]|uniref:ATP-binding protein n=1 Tax=Arthrobacter sp. ISL-30 TaxID=2819109 RepID=UPI001BE7DE51|nr:ATP-binding protein [Arthrobacter sp. ISL-30]MBT2515470.1 histidine kinase [Arthrobacter sp. ISL-30]